MVILETNDFEELIPKLKKKALLSKSIILYDGENDERVYAALYLGVNGFISKLVDSDGIAECISKVLENERVFPASS